MIVPEEILSSFRNHIFMCFKFLGLGEPTAIQYEIARQIEEGPTDQIIAAGRGTGKSTITACLASWLWLKNPNSTFLVLSNTQGKAIDFVSQVRKILNVVPYCIPLLPKDNDKDNALGFNLGVRTKFSQDLSCTARGISSQITGLHSDFVICDDIEVSGKNETPITKDTLLKKLGELESIRNKGSRVVFLGTPHYQDSVYNTLKMSYPMIKYPAEMPDLTSESQIEEVAPWIIDLALESGEPTQPERFGVEELAARKAKMGPGAYSLQYKLDTTLNDLDKYPLKLRDLLVIDVDCNHGPEKIIWQGSTTNKEIHSFGLSGDLIVEPMHISTNYLPYQNTHMCIDPSGRGSDETGICISSVLSGVIFIHELLGIPGGYSDATLLKITKLAIEYKVKLIRVESNFGDGLFTKVLAPYLNEHIKKIGIEEFKVSKQKELRIIETLEPVMSNHRLVVDKKVIKDKENQIQITRIHRGRGALSHDDRVDVLASAVEFYKDHMALNTDRAMEKNKQQIWEKTIKDWSENFRASDYVPCSGATRVTGSNQIKKKESNQWGW